MSHLTDSLMAVWPQLDVDARIKAAAIDSLTADSREVTESSVFLALKGHGRNGIEFIANALEQGAVAVLFDEHDAQQVSAVSASHSHKLIALPHLIARLPELLRTFYPAVTDIKKVGVTGTNGKTSVSQMVAQLAVFTEQKTQQKAGVIGTMGAGIVRKQGDSAQFKTEWQTANTTPHLVTNFQLMAKMAEQDVKLMTMEVSSIGIDQRRVAGLGFDVTIMTNLTQDHLDYHGDMATYEQIKKQFFVDNPNSTMVFNLDDPYARRWYQQFSAEHHLIAVGEFNKQDNFAEFLCYQNVQSKNNGFEFTLRSHQGDFRVSLPLFGRFNIANVLCAMAALTAFGVAIADLVAGLKMLRPVDGRMEQFDYHYVKDSDKGIVKVIVDYAHTPDALSQALNCLKNHCQGQLWCIFGCGGDRDKGKRPLMAQAAEQFADRIVVTNDNPRHELPQAIVMDICAGFAQDTQYQVELDRKQAIAMTLAQANDDDIVLIAGKGHETYQVFGDDVIEYDERAFVRQCCVSGLDSADTVNEVVTS